MARVKGNTTPTLSFKNGSAALKDLGAYVVSFEFTDGDGDPLTMADYAAGTRPVALNVEWALDFDANGAFEYLTANAGAAGVTYQVKINGAGAVGQLNPTFGGTCTLPAKPLFSVEAGTEDQTFESEIQLDTYVKAIA